MLLVTRWSTASNTLIYVLMLDILSEMFIVILIVRMNVFKNTRALAHAEERGMTAKASSILAGMSESYIDQGLRRLLNRLSAPCQLAEKL